MYHFASSSLCLVPPPPNCPEEEEEGWSWEVEGSKRESEVEFLWVEVSCDDKGGVCCGTELSGSGMGEWESASGTGDWESGRPLVGCLRLVSMGVERAEWKLSSGVVSPELLASELVTVRPRVAMLDSAT